MALITLPAPIAFPFMTRVATTPAVGNVLLDAASEKAAAIVDILQAGTIDALVWRTATVTTGATLDIRIETIDGTTGNPSGTLWATNTNAAQVVADADDNVTFTTVLTAGAVVVAGDRLAVVIANPAAAFGNLNVRSIDDISILGLTMATYRASFLGGAWTKTANSALNAGLRYNDAAFYPAAGLSPFNAFTDVSLNTGSTPDEGGNRILVPFKGRCCGAWFVIGGGGGAADFDVVLYDNAGTAAATQAMDAHILTVTTENPCVKLFTTKPTINANDVVRLVIKPSTVNNITLDTVTLAAAGHAGAWPGGTGCYYTSRTDAGAWTDTNTQLALCGLLFDQIDNGASAAGMLVHPGMTGGMRG